MTGYKQAAPTERYACGCSLENGKIVVASVRFLRSEIALFAERQPVRALIQQLLGLRFRLGLGEQKSLTVVTAEILKHGELAFGLDAFGDDAHLQVFGERNNRLQDL